MEVGRERIGEKEKDEGRMGEGKLKGRREEGVLGKSGKEGSRRGCACWRRWRGD